MENAARHSDVIAKEITCFAPNANKVFLGGTFNNWNNHSTPMKKGKDGNWTASLDLAPGHYEYKFAVDDKWCCRPGCEDKPKLGCPECVTNAFGTMNRVLNVS